VSAAREAALLVAAGAGLGALVLAGVPPILVGIALLLVLLSPWLRGPLAGLPWALATVAVVVAAGWATLSGYGIAGLGGLQAWLLVQRLLARHGPSDDRIVVLLSAMMLVLGGARVPDVAFAVPLVLWAGAAPLALAWGALPERLPVRAGWRAWGIVPAVLLGGAALFPIVPRWGAAPVPSPAGPALTGFAPEMTLGGLGTLLDDPTPVLRVRVRGEVPHPFLLRGAVLDAFDGRRWRHTTAPVPWRGEGEGDLRLSIREASVVPEVLFSAGDPVAVDAPGARVLRDVDGALWAVRPDHPIRYTVWARTGPAPAALDEADRARLTALPAGLDPRIPALARTVVPEGAAGLDAARAVRSWLAENLAYTRSPGDLGTETPLSDFLFSRRTGHCEYFASALVVLVRERKVPARLVEGFAGGEHNVAGGYWLFRRDHAHTWAEVYSEGAWWPIDATPGPGAPPPPPVADRWLDALRTAWTERVVGFDRGVQVAAAIDLGRFAQAWVVPGPSRTGPPWAGWAVLGVLAVGLAALGVGIGRRAAARLGGEAAARPAGRVAAAHAAALRTLRRRGLHPPSSLPPVAPARGVRARAGDVAEPLERLAWLHYAVTYGGADDRALSGEAWDLARAVRQVPAP